MRNAAKTSRRDPAGLALRILPPALAILTALAWGAAVGGAQPSNDRLDLARKHLENQKLDRALKEVDRVLASDPAHLEAWRLRGELFLRKADLENALVSWQEAYRLAPHDLELATSIGDLLVRRNDRLEEALAVYESVLARQPENVRLLISIGSIHERRERWAPAAEAYRRALGVDPNLVRARSSLGVVLFKQGDYDVASRELRKAIELSPRDLRSRVFSGLSQNHLGNYDLALDEMKEAILIDPHAANQVIGVREQMPQFRSLIERFLAAYDAAPGEAGRSFDLAVIYFYAEDFEAAWRFLKQAEHLRYPIPLELKEVIYSRRRLRVP